MAILELENLYRDEAPSLRGLSLTVGSGEVHVFDCRSAAERGLLRALLLSPGAALVHRGMCRIWGLPSDHPSGELLRICTFAAHSPERYVHAPVLLADMYALEHPAHRSRAFARLNAHVHAPHGLAHAALVFARPDDTLTGLLVTHRHHLHNGRLRSS